MAYDYEKAKAAYESLTSEQQQQFIDRNKNNATVQQFARDYAREKNQTSTTTTPTPNYQNQGAGNYVYNEKTGYYENQTDTSSNTTNQGLAPRPENVKTETPTKQEEKVVTTVPEIKQQGQLKPLSQDYYNQTSDEAQNKIRANLNGYRQTNPELFSTYEDFKKNFSYDSRDEVQKQTLDNWYTGYQKSMELAAIPTNELYTQYKDGIVSLSDLETLRISNPTKYAELQETINKGNIISAYDDDKGADTGMNIQDMAYQFLAQSFNKLMNGDSSSGASQIFKEYQDKMDNPEMLDLSDKCTEVQEQMENIQTDIDSMRKSVEAEYEGTGASKAKINAIIADRTYDLQLQLRTLNSEYNKYATQYNNRMQQYQNEFNMQLQEYQINQSERQVQMKELGFALDLMNFETNDQKQEREWNYWVRQQEYQNGNINSKDYQTRYKAALTSVQNLLSQYEGIPMERSAEQMAQDVLKAIDGGSDLGAELTKINKLIQQKPEYKQVYNQTFGTSSQGFGKTVKIGDTDYVEYNGQLYTAEDFNKKFGNAISVSPEVMSQGLETFKTRMQSLVATGGAIRKGWCGEPVNDYLKSIGSNVQYDDDLQTKLDSITPGAGPKVGSIAIWDGSSFNSPDAKKYGHVAIVTGIDEKNGTITVLESNGQAHKMGMGYGKYNMANVTGYYDPSAGYGGTSSSSDAFTAAGNNIALNLGSVSATNTFNETLKKYVNDGDYTRAFEYITTQAKQSTDSDTRSALNSAESAISALVSIRDGLDAYRAAGGDTNIFAGTAEQVANKIGKTTDPELKKLATQINVAIQNYRKAISGAAFSESEAAEYAAIFPSTKNDKELNDALIDGALQTMLQNLNSNYSQILGNETYVDLLKAYEDSTGDIYDYYGNKQGLTKYLKDKGYFNTSRKNNSRKGKRWVNLGNNTVVEPNMSEYQSSTTNDLGNGLLSKTVNGVTLYSYDNGKTWN